MGALCSGKCIETHPIGNPGRAEILDLAGLAPCGEEENAARSDGVGSSASCIGEDKTRSWTKVVWVRCILVLRSELELADG